MAIIAAIVLGGVALVGSLLIPTSWIYDTLALRIAFGPVRAAQEHITVQKITKPSTVTFSNGEQIDVGMKPAVFSCIFRFGATIPLLICYLLLIKRCGPKWIHWSSGRCVECKE